MQHGLIRFIVLIAVTSAASLVSATESALDVAVGDFTLVSKKRVTRVAVEFTYQAIATNFGDDLQNVAVSIVSNSPHTTVVDGSLRFGDMAAGGGETSEDTFTIRHDRRYPFAWSDLDWTVTGHPPMGSASWIGTTGGTIEDEAGAVLTVPPGALDEHHLISIATHLDESSLPAALLDFKGGATFGPSGTVFDIPVTIKLPLTEYLTPGMKYPLFEFDEQKGSWTLTDFIAMVDEEGLFATAEVTHFSTLVIIGSILEPGLAEIFGMLSRDAGHILYSQLFDDFLSRMSNFFQIGFKTPNTFGDRPFQCYENVGLDVDLTYSVTKVFAAGELPVEIEGDRLSMRMGREGTVQILFNFPDQKQISTTDPNAAFPGDTEHTLIADVNVWLACGAPRIVMYSDKPQLDSVANEDAQITAQLMCGDDPMGDQAIEFSVSGAGDINIASSTTKEDGTAETELTAYTNDSCTDDVASVSAEYLACTGEPEETTVQNSFDMPTNFHLDGTWSSIEVADETGCDEGVNTYRTVVTMTGSDGALTAIWPGGHASFTKNMCSLSGFGGESEDNGYSYGGGSGTITPSGNTMTASSTWTWRGVDPDTGQPDSCSGSSRFTLNR